MKRALVALAVSALLTAPAFAQQPPAAPKIDQTNPKHDAPAAEDFSGPRTYQLFTKDDLEKMGPSKFPDLFGRRPARPGDGKLAREPYTGGGKLYQLTPASFQTPSGNSVLPPPPPPCVPPVEKRPSGRMPLPAPCPEPPPR